MDDLTEAHSHCIRNRDELSRSNRCGCFFCLAVFAPPEVTQWISEREGPFMTAQCPRCGIDSVIGDASGFPITEEFLGRMESRWFGLRNKPEKR
jgi:hypothetical protein